MAKRKRMLSCLGMTFDLATPDGRLDALRALRPGLLALEQDTLTEFRATDPWQVLEAHVVGDLDDEPRLRHRFCTRQALRRTIGRRDNSPELCDLLARESHPPGTVFAVLFWGRRHSWLRFVVCCGGPQDN